jgi:hypothetical protein
VGHVVHSGASEVQNVNAQFSMLWWDQYKFQKRVSAHFMLNLCF